MQPEDLGHSASPFEVESPEHHPEHIPAKTTFTAKRFFASKFVRVAGCALLAVCSAAFYRVRELAAALILFSALFAVVMIGVLILWLVERGAHAAALWLENQMAHIFARRVVLSAPVKAKRIAGDRPWN